MNIQYKTKTIVELVNLFLVEKVERSAGGWSEATGNLTDNTAMARTEIWPVFTLNTQRIGKT